MPTRYVIDFNQFDVLGASKFPELFSRVQAEVLPARKKAAAAEEKRNLEVLAERPNATVNRHHANFLKHWWRMSYDRDDMMEHLATLERYIVCVRVTKRPIFDFVSSSISPSDALTVFGYDDDYTFGILQSDVHWAWFTARCSTMKSDPRYTSNTVFDSFPWPQNPSKTAVKAVAAAAVALRTKRRELLRSNNLCLRELYRTIELPGAHPLKKAIADLDAAVRRAFGMGKKTNTLQHLLDLNRELAASEDKGLAITVPGLPIPFKKGDLRTTDCIRP